MSPTKESVSSNRMLVDMVHIAKAFGRATVLADVNLQVCAGEVHGLLGENGAGKSTLKIAPRPITASLNAQFGDAKVIVLDEPTASLTPREEKPLFATIARLKKAGVGVIYISHRLNEVLAITDRITVLRNGLVAGAIPTSEATVPMLVEMMSGRRVEARPSYR